MKRITLLVLAVLLVQLLFYAQLVVGLLGSPSFHSIDYVSFYSAGRLMQAGQPLYDRAAQLAVQEWVAGATLSDRGPLPFLRPPVVALLAALTADEQYRASYLRWQLVLLAATLGTAATVRRMLHAHGWPRRDALLASLSSLCFFPLLLSQLTGQDTALILLGAVGGLAALPLGHGRAGGALLALALLKPQLGLMLAAPLLAAGRRAAGWFVAVGAGMAGASLALVGWAGARDFLALIRAAAQGEDYGFNQEEMYNLAGALLRLAPAAPVAAVQAVAWCAFALPLLGLCVAWARAGGAVGPAGMGLTTLAALFTSPHLYAHDLCLLLVPCLAAALLVARRGGRWAALAPAIPALASLLLLAAMLLPAAAGFLLVYAVMAALAATLVFAERVAARPAAGALDRRAMGEPTA